MAKSRDSKGQLQPDKSRFLSGITALTDYVSVPVLYTFWLCQFQQQKMNVNVMNIS